MLALAVGFLKVFGLRAASAGMAVWQSAGTVVIAAAAVVGILYAAAELGRHWERGREELAAAKAQVQAVKAGADIAAKIEQKAAADAAELAGKDEASKKVRDATSDDSRIVFAADDGWLRAKRGGAASH